MTPGGVQQCGSTLASTSTTAGLSRRADDVRDRARLSGEGVAPGESPLQSGEVPGGAGAFPIADAYPKEWCSTRNRLLRRLFLVLRRWELISHIQNTYHQSNVQAPSAKLRCRAIREGAEIPFEDPSTKRMVTADVAVADPVGSRLEWSFRRQSFLTSMRPCVVVPQPPAGPQHTLVCRARENSERGNRSQNPDFLSNEPDSARSTSGVPSFPHHG